MFSSSGLKKNRNAQLEHTLLVCKKITSSPSFDSECKTILWPKKELAFLVFSTTWLCKPKLSLHLPVAINMCDHNTDTWCQHVSQRTPWEGSCHSCEAGRSRELWHILLEEVWSGRTLLVCWWRCCSWPQLSVAAGHLDLGEHCCSLCTKDLEEKRVLILECSPEIVLVVYYTFKISALSKGSLLACFSTNTDLIWDL